MPLSNVVGPATNVFRFSVRESFGRHVRALERMLIDDLEIDLDSIRVHLEPRAPKTYGSIHFEAEPYYPAYDVNDVATLDQDPSFRPLELARRLTIHIVVGTGGNPQLDPKFGPSISDMETVLDPQIRVTLAHELAHIALLHIFSPDGRIVGMASDRPGAVRVEQEADATRYSGFLVKLISDYLRDRVRAVEGGSLRSALEHHCQAIGEMPGVNDSIRQALRRDVESITGRDSWVECVRAELGESPIPHDAPIEIREDKDERMTEVWVGGEKSHSYEWEETGAATEAAQRRLCMFKACGWLASMGPGAA